MGQSYLNHEQAPNAYLPRPALRVSRHARRCVAAGGFVGAAPCAQKMPAAEINLAGAELRIAPAQGPVQTRAMLQGGGFPANAPVSVIWGTQAGSRVSRQRLRAAGTTDRQSCRRGPDGRLDAPLQIPEDLGGLHAVTIRSKEQTLARTFFAIETSVVSISPTSGPPGTPVTIHLKGVGWTDFDNIYVATYDNALYGLRVRLQQSGRRRRQLHRSRFAGRACDRFLSRDLPGARVPISSCIACRNSPTPTITPATRSPRCASRSRSHALRRDNVEPCDFFVGQRHCQARAVRLTIGSRSRPTATTASAWSSGTGLLAAPRTAAASST